MQFQNNEEVIIQDILSGKRIFGLKKEKNFSFWFKILLRIADIVEDRFSAKGFYMYPWYGLELIKRVIGHLEELLIERGHREERYPSFVPFSVFTKEKDFFEGFQGEAYLITETLRGDKLEDPLVVRPTSETIIYPLWSLRIKSHRQLPIKVFQTVNVFRLETKMTKPLLRLREVAFFNEAHTAHKTLDEAEIQIKEALEIYKKFYDDLEIPYLVVKTLEWDTFPGALYNYDIVTVLPDGKCLELGSVINLGTKFSKIFDIKYVDEKGKTQYVFQTCYGISERAVGALIAIHGDSKGLVLPPEFAPIQIVIVPIYYSEEQRKKVISKCNEIKEILRARYRVHLDDTDKTPGYKYHYWEMKGVPIRIEIGPRDLEKGTLIIFRRDRCEKDEIKEDKLLEKIIAIFAEYSSVLKKKAQEYFKNSIVTVTNLETFKEQVKNKPVIIPFCGEKECAKNIEDNFQRDVIGYIENFSEELPDKCIICEKDAKAWVLVGKTY